MTVKDINDIIKAVCPNDEDFEKPCISPKYLRQELEQLALDQRQWNEEPTTKNDLALIHTEGLDNGIRCAMCTNSIKSDRGCDGSCVVNNAMYKEVMDVIENHIVDTDKMIEPITKNDLGVDANKLLADCEKMSFDIEIFNKPLKVVALDAVKNIAKDLINSEKPNKSEILIGSTTKNDLGVECIDRAELLKAMDIWDKFGYTARYGLERLDKDDKGFVPYVKYDDMVNCVKGMPSVTPQEPRKGHWIDKQRLFESCSAECSSCHKRSNGYLHDNGFSLVSKYFDFCPKCGSDNREVEE